MSRNPDGSVTIETIGDFIDERIILTAYCEPCHRSAALDLAALANRLGRDHSAMAPALKPRIKCAQCGRKDLAFTISSGTGWDGAGGHGNNT